jgi:hypothetical protein
MTMETVRDFAFHKACEKMTKAPIGDRRVLSQHVSETGGNHPLGPRAKDGLVGKDGFGSVGRTALPDSVYHHGHVRGRVAVDGWSGRQGNEGISGTVADETGDVRDGTRADARKVLCPGS